MQLEQMTENLNKNRATVPPPLLVNFFTVTLAQKACHYTFFLVNPLKHSLPLKGLRTTLL